MLVQLSSYAQLARDQKLACGAFFCAIQTSGLFLGSVNVGREALETTTSNNSGFINQSSIVCQKICGKPMEKPMVSYRW